MTDFLQLPRSTVHPPAWPWNLDLCWDWNKICWNPTPGFVQEWQSCQNPFLVFLYTDTCFSFQTKFTGFKFTRVSFWHISNRHNDWSDLVRSVCGVKLVLVEFRSSSDLVFLFTSSRNCFKTASLASSDRFSSTEGGDRTQGASAEKTFEIYSFVVTWSIF